VTGTTEVICLSLINGFLGKIGVHPAHRADRVIGGLLRNLSVGRVRIWIQPSFTLIFHLVRCFRGHGMAEIAFDHAQRQIDTGGESARTGKIARLNESRSSFDLNIGISLLEINTCPMVCSCRFA